jgi:hypothetical protein
MRFYSAARDGSDGWRTMAAASHAMCLLESVVGTCQSCRGCSGSGGGQRGLFGANECRANRPGSSVSLDRAAVADVEMARGTSLPSVCLVRYDSHAAIVTGYGGTPIVAGTTDPTR